MPPNAKPNSREAYKSAHADEERGCLEIQVSSATITWVNESIKQSCISDNKSILNSSIYGLVDETYRARLTSIFHEYAPRDIPKKTLWPVPSSKGKMGWWMVNIEYADEDYILVSTNLILASDKSELGYKFASLSADNTFLASVALSEIYALKREITAFRKSINEEVKSSREQIESAVEASRKAEQAAIKNKEATDDLKTHVVTQFNEHTKEITKLMTSDVIHDSRMTIFEEHVKKTTSEALTRIVKQADQSGKGLSKKVSVPVTITAAAMAVLQWLLAKYGGG